MTQPPPSPLYMYNVLKSCLQTHEALGGKRVWTRPPKITTKLHIFIEVQCCLSWVLCVMNEIQTWNNVLLSLIAKGEHVIEHVNNIKIGIYIMFLTLYVYMQGYKISVYIYRRCWIGLGGGEEKGLWPMKLLNLVVWICLLGYLEWTNG